MRTAAHIACAPHVRVRSRLWRLVLALIVAWIASPCAGTAQTTVQEGSTLHVYSTLLQIPVLILSNKHQALPVIPAGDFQVTLGKDAPFKPRLVRLEGDDPITMAILLDGSSAGSLLPQSVDGLATMVRDHLQPHDRVAVYAMDGCKLLRLTALGAMHPNAMRLRVQQAADMAPYNAYAPKAEACPQPVGLWDATDYLVQTLAGEPGRRVVLAVTNGRNEAGHLSATAARRDANHDGVTVFALAERYKVPSLGPVFPQTTAGWRVSSLLAELTEGSGGMIVESTRSDVEHALRHFVELLRGRYIVEFQRPAHTVAGVNVIDVRCGLPKAFIRPAGTSMPIADPGDSTVVHGFTANSLEALPPLELPEISEPVAPAGPQPAHTPAVQRVSPLDITDEAVPMSAPLTAGGTVK